MDEDKRFTICKECRHCSMNSPYAIVAGLTPRCGIETYIDPVYGECYKEEGLCRDKNKGDCPDFVAKDAVRACGRYSGVFMEAARKAFGLT